MKPDFSGFLKALLHSKWAPAGAGLLGFLEGSFVFFPIEPLAIPVMATNYKRAFFIAAFLIIGNIVGACLIYAIGANVAEPALQGVLAYVGASNDYAQIAQSLRENAFGALLIAGLTPFPFQAATAAAGAVDVPFTTFLAAVTLARGARYLALALMVAFVGARAGAFIERYEAVIVAGGFVLFVGVAGAMLFF